MKYTPHPYQEYAAQRIVESPKVGLFLACGLGKTIITLSAVSELLACSMVNKVLIIAPLRVAESTWSTEAAKWEHTRHLSISKVLGARDKRVKALEAPADLYIINRENTGWIADYYGKRWPFDMIVIDELSSFKSYRSERFKKLKGVLPHIRRIVGLTGIPAPNGLLDLWPQIYLMDGGERLGKFITHYRNEYFVPDKVNRQTGIVYSWALKPGAGEDIHTAISDLCVSMSAEDYLTLPPRIDRVVNVELPQKAQRQYAQFEKEMILSLMGADINAGSAAVLAGKLLQFSNGAIYDENRVVREIHRAKLDALTDVVEAANGNPLLIFYLFKHDVTRITAHLKAEGYPVAMLKTDQDIQQWNRGETPILLVHPASAGHGLNLQAGGHTVVWFGLPWSLELYEQGNGRIHRQGQERPVVVHHLASIGTIDEDVIDTLKNKGAGPEALLEAVKAKFTQSSKTA